MFIFAPCVVRVLPVCSENQKTGVWMRLSDLPLPNSGFEFCVYFILCMQYES